jgi:hypothetical protein
MKLDDYKLPELRTVAKYLEIEGYNKMRRADLEAQIFLKEVSNAMENNMKREHHQQVKYFDLSVVGAPHSQFGSPFPKGGDLELDVANFYIRNNINTHQL